MDVTKYIGYFLFKNQLCYIHGLGNLELKRRPAYYDGKILHAPFNEIVFSPTGAVDESLANFIATNEQTSISKALNELKDFSTKLRAELQAGREVAIPTLGRFAMIDDKVRFITDPKLQIPLPSLGATQYQLRGQQEAAPFQPPPPAYYPETQQPLKETYRPEQEEEEEEEGTGINWLRVLLVLFLLAAISVGIFFGYRYLNLHKTTTPIQAITPVKKDSVAPMPFAMPAISDSTKIDSSKTFPVVDTVVIGDEMLEDSKPQPQEKKVLYNISLYKSYDLEKATSKYQELKAINPGVEINTDDSVQFYVTIRIHGLQNRKALILDSVKRKFNVSSVRLY